jgi:protein O-mannosyl-transferase
MDAATPNISAPAKLRPQMPDWRLALWLALATLALYSPVLRHDFVNYDDDIYVTANPHVQAGLSWANLKWALASPVNNNWHPLTVLSHMLDCQLYGLNPGGHHLTSILLHALNTALVFLLLRRLTGAVWRSLTVAALFGWHPVHVESVAWIAERKDVLSACFGLLSIYFYARYAAPGRVDRKSQIANYLLSLLCLALGLMSKAMLLTWPFVLLLLDYWPLNRGAGREAWGSRWRQLVWEKVPFFALTAAVGIVTFAVQKRGGALDVGETLSLGARAGNALVSYCRYLGKLCWPTGLEVFYPHPGLWPLAAVLLAGGLLTGLTALVVWQRRRHPFLLVGWLWFVGTLVPVIQLIQTGSHAMADRYTYLPSLGLLILMVWGGYELTRGWRNQVALLAATGTVTCLLCAALARHQLGYWQDSETLFRHALAVSENNFIAHNNLAVALVEKGRIDEAIPHYQAAIRLEPGWVDGQYNLGVALENKGLVDEAIRQYQAVIRLKSDYAPAYNNLGNLLEGKGETGAAVGQYQAALRLKPDYTKAHYNLGSAFYNQGRVDDAVREYQEAIRLNPDDAEARDNLGIALAKQGRMDEAIAEFQAAVRLRPDDVRARDNLAHALAIKNAPAGR